MQFQPAVQQAYTSTSLPGHLIHLVMKGRVEQTSNGRRQLLEPGTIVWYHEDEWVESCVVRAPWTFYSVNFTAKGLTPPNFESRLLPGRQKLEPIFRQLLTAWRSAPSWRRTCVCQSHLLALIAAIDSPSSDRAVLVPESKLWWEAESWARSHIHQHICLADLCAETGRSANTIARACHAAVGMAPMKRLKQIRLSFAQGLVHFSSFNMTEIAQRIGYARVHEFSRDYRKAYGAPPTAQRRLRCGE